MDEFAIEVSHLSKRYRLGASASTDTLREALGSMMRRPHRLLRSRSEDHHHEYESIWALRGIDLRINEGEIVGIIGRNGAGKSTFLKVLSRITSPTEGLVRIRGRVGSLLEVGTGFHPELTGRENIQLNAAILGMTRREIARKFDDIVAFAEVEKFIDTPVKRYSSGMSVRLAFAVAAHLDPDVIMVDEVLAVGDASFQRRCLGQMDQAARSGRTILLVSHNMPTIASLATRCLWIDSGRIVADGEPSIVIQQYLRGALSSTEGSGRADLRLHPRRRENLAQEVVFRQISTSDAGGNIRSVFNEGEDVAIEVALEIRKPIRILELRVHIRDFDGTLLFMIPSGRRDVELGEGIQVGRCILSPNYLRPGRYRVDLTAGTGLPQDYVEEAIFFTVEHDPAGYDDTLWRSDKVGFFRFPYSWSALMETPES